MTLNRANRTVTRPETVKEALGDMALVLFGARRQLDRRDARRQTFRPDDVLVLPGGRRVRVDRPACDSDPLGEVVYAGNGEPWHVL